MIVRVDTVKIEKALKERGLTRKQISLKMGLEHSYAMATVRILIPIIDKKLEEENERDFI